ncbi:hypothetical protein UCRPA7_404 [Phaeoacremonium minimum UCRPA7]|uniref:Uncharacterized protein n=1 Tax=Phaeoacremonium minimum (strain UCR-PA7) TaxID=1286976 RepID=R8BXI9_PHAM7|nr:hypothetical protein UCRPA7_404 [Phaeoacremonium minimum UCRPA7]EOO04121.1 hypothetical protein UCRPA7_404 [Phaeoacremonium minimum UCRPA7]
MSGITDEAAVAEHDLIQHAEDDLNKAQGNQSNPVSGDPEQKKSYGLGEAPKQTSKVEKVKEALHINKK